MSKVPNATNPMPTPHLYPLLFGQLRRWVTPKTQRPPQWFAAIVAVILQAHTLCLCRCLPCPSDQHSQDQSHMERLQPFSLAFTTPDTQYSAPAVIGLWLTQWRTAISYFARNKHISAESFHIPVPKHFLQTLQAAILQLTPDRKTLLEQFYLMAMCSERSINLSQGVLGYGNTTHFEEYRSVWERLRSYGSLLGLIFDNTALRAAA